MLVPKNNDNNDKNNQAYFAVSRKGSLTSFKDTARQYKRELIKEVQLFRYKESGKERRLGGSGVGQLGFFLPYINGWA